MAERSYKQGFPDRVPLYDIQPHPGSMAAGGSPGGRQMARQRQKNGKDRHQEILEAAARVITDR
ncbi:MAG TPA: hypothetical protein VLB31_08775 [Actinomycetota bacterium]|nr:hypothetical protein [Actinomycetota bacterium]